FFSVSLAKKHAEKPKLKPAPLNRIDRKRELRGPRENTEYMNRMEAFVQETIETLARNSAKTFDPEE
ncbi:hypothetical protein OX88_22875, partial [Pseudomonas coronafaciens pv. porri]